jgi:hypothetical protein
MVQFESRKTRGGAIDAAARRVLKLRVLKLRLLKLRLLKLQANTSQP